VRFSATSSCERKVDVRLPGKGDSNARPDHLIITTIKRIRTRRLSIKNSLSASCGGVGGACAVLGHFFLYIQGGPVFEAHRFLYHSTLGLRVIKKKKKGPGRHRGGWRR